MVDGGEVGAWKRSQRARLTTDGVAESTPGNMSILGRGRCLHCPAVSCAGWAALSRSLGRASSMAASPGDSKWSFRPEAKRPRSHP
jgi:hypothetical protein